MRYIDWFKCLIFKDWAVKKVTKVNSINLLVKSSEIILFLHLHFTLLLLMSPSRVDLSHSSSWRIFSPALDLLPVARKFYFSSKIGKCELVFNLIFFSYFFCLFRRLGGLFSVTLVANNLKMTDFLVQKLVGPRKKV